MATGLEKVSFYPILKNNDAKESLNYLKIVLISHASKLMHKILQARLQQYVNQELPDVQLDLEKAEEPEIKLPTFIGSWRNPRNSRKISTSASLTMPNPFIVWITASWKILKEMGIPDHPYCLLRNLYVCQEARVRTRYGITDWFQIGKAIQQGCILSPCLFN